MPKEDKKPKVEEIKKEIKVNEEMNIKVEPIKEEKKTPEEKEIEKIKEPIDYRERLKLKRKEEKRRKQEAWVPKTRIGKLVKTGKIVDIDEIFDKSAPILEEEIVDKLIPELQSELLAIGQSKGKFGGGKRRAWRQTQKKTAEGNVPSFACMAIVGDGRGHLGIGMGKAKETLPAREKALRNAKLNLIRLNRGCGSFDCACVEKHSIISKVEGKCGSAKIILMPAPKGTGLAIEDECKKIMKIAGIKDIYSKTFGQSKTKFNLAKACLIALEKTNKLKIK